MDAGNDVAKALSHMANSLSPENGMQILVNELVNEHPTIQQAITGHLILNFVRLMHNRHMSENYDGRNKMACIVCDRMWKAVKDIVSADDNEWTRLALV